MTSIIQMIPEFINHINRYQFYTDHNQNIFDITEGDLYTQLVEYIKQQQTGRSAEIAIQRAAPINVFSKITDKLTKLYENDPVRSTEKAADMAMVEFYSTKSNSFLNDGNFNYNAYKNVCIEYYHDKEVGELQMRAVPSQLFLPYSNDKINPLRMTHIIKFMGKVWKKARGENGGIIDVEKNKYWAYSNTEFISFDQDGEIIKEDLLENEGVNPYGTIPFAYRSKSRNLLIPKINIDDVRMTLLVPCLYTDLNFASKFLSNPILYTIDCQAENYELNPNVIWDLKSDEQGNTPKIGVVESSPNIEQQINMIGSELGAWMETKSVKPGKTAGRLTAESYASGIALIIGEMDTTKAVKKQGKEFKLFERTHWQKTATIHNYLSKAGLIKEKKVFADEKLIVNVSYSEQKEFETKTDKANRLNLEVKSGLNSRKRALKEYHPDLNDKEIEELITEIDNEQTIIITPKKPDNK